VRLHDQVINYHAITMHDGCIVGVAHSGAQQALNFGGEP
jgi:hypothetical protein